MGEDGHSELAGPEGSYCTVSSLSLPSETSTAMAMAMAREA